MKDKSYVGDIHRIISGANAVTNTRCMYFDRDGKRCKSLAIQSHSLQKNGPLASIAESNHVVKVGPSLKARPMEARLLFERTGVKKASRFPGFCEQHDSEVFSAIETKNLSLDKSSAIVFAIRAIALELYRKTFMIATQNETIRYLEQKRKPEKIEVARLIRRGAIAAEKANTDTLKRLFRCWHKEVPSTFHYRMVQFENPYPFACTGAFEPE